jgi:hypothetical protein
MRPYFLNLFGLVVDIVGVALLSVEAIKLENLRKLRDFYLKPLHERSKPLAITFSDNDAPPAPRLRYQKTMLDGCFWWGVTHTGSGAMTLGVLWLVVDLHMQGVIPWMVALWHGWGVLGRSIAGFFGLWLVFVAATGIGEGYHYGTIWLTRKVVDLADYIDKRTPDGTIGLIGFFTVVVGFVLQFVGTWLGRPH